LVHAKDPAAVAFYSHFGFLASPIAPQTMLLAVSRVRASLVQALER
jgi:hypothetical protein